MKEKPNIILITLDCVRPDHLGYTGYSRVDTPNIDRLADEGILFTNARTNCPVTLPSHCSLLTGLLPLSHNIRANGLESLDSAVPTLPQVLKKAGYNTSAFVGAFVLHSRFGLSKEFDFYDDNMMGNRLRDKLNAKMVIDSLLRKNKLWQGFKLKQFHRRGDVLTHSALSWIRRNSENRFFAWLHYFDAHHPYMLPIRYRIKYRASLYDGEVSYIDKNIGHLLKGLSKLNLLDNTLLIVTSDHGESLGEHDEYGHGENLFEENLRVPLIFWNRGIFDNPVTLNCFAQSVDLTPTVLDILDLKFDSNRVLDGKSLLSVMQSNNSVHQKYPEFFYAESLFPKLQHGKSEIRCVIMGEWKYILYLEEGKELLFNLEEDPGEQNNLINSQQEIRSKLRKRLLSIVNKDDRFIKEQQVVDEEVNRALKALGYL